MICPACRNALRKAKTGDLVIDLCPNCRGMWFDDEEFSVVARALAEKMDHGAELKDLFKPRDVHEADSDIVRLCPRCQRPLHNFNYAYDSNILLDKCTQCDGIWADRGELHQVAAHLKGDPRTEEIGKYFIKRDQELRRTAEMRSTFGHRFAPWFVLGPTFILPLSDNQPREKFPFLTISIIAACVVTFIVSMFVVDSPREFILRYGHTPANFFGIGLITSDFFHGSIMHLLGNMFCLWLFGDNIEDRLGRLRFVLFYFACGIVASAVHAIANPGSTVPCIGASGAISGVMGAYMIFFPTARIKVLFCAGIIEVGAIFYLGGWFVLQLIYGFISISGDFSRIAWFSHIGGFAFGAFIALLWKKRSNDD